VSPSIGTIARIYRYPVKSLAAEPLDRARLDGCGIEGDRASALFVASTEHARTGKTYRGKENELLHTLPTRDAARDVARTRGVALDVRDDGPYFDDSPVSIVFDTWIAALEGLVHESIDPLRFRANLYVAASAACCATEADLVGTTLAIGDVTLECTATIKRCVTISYDIPTGRPDPHIARAVATELDNVMGIYCTVRQGGTIAVGDAVLTEPEGVR
jgi:uncharacterized protein YcbX